MNRYFTVLRIFWSTSIAAEMEYRANFVMAAFSSLVTLAGSLFTLHLFYRGGYELGGWPWHDALMVIAAYTVINGLREVLMDPNRIRITEHVREGTLDFVLLKPIDSQFWLSTWKIGLWGVPNVFFGIALAIYAATLMPEPPSVLGWLAGAYGIVLATLIIHSISYMLATTTIWFVKLMNITIAMQTLLEAGRYPIGAYPWAYQFFFTFVLPVALMTTVPAQAVTGRPEAATWLAATTGVTVVLFWLSRWFWRFALRSYTSASS